jgi:hypothetical protein
MVGMRRTLAGPLRPLGLLSLLGLLVLALCSGREWLPSNASRDVGEHFADALEGRSDAPVETYLAPGATIYLQGGGELTRGALPQYLERMKQNHQVLRRMSPVYVTRNGAGWLLGVVHTPELATSDVSAESATLWMEVAIDSGSIRRGWIHFTLETLQALHEPTQMYLASVAAYGLPLPDAWSDGTPALLAAAERYDAQVDAGRPVFDVRAGVGVLAAVAAVTAVGMASATATARARQRAVAAQVKTDQRASLAAQATTGQRTSALLYGLRERRQQASATTGTSIPI